MFAYKSMLSDDEPSISFIEIKDDDDDLQEIRVQPEVKSEVQIPTDLPAVSEIAKPYGKPIVTPPADVKPKPPATKPSSCPVTTMKCIPCVAGEKYCRSLPGETSGYEGWACQNNNPGNIRYYASSSDPLLRVRLITEYGGKSPCGEKANYMVFTDYVTGRNALKAYIKAINDGKHPAYSECGNCNLEYFFSKYAPAGDQNDPDSYSHKVAEWIGENAETTTLAYIVKNKLDRFVDAIQRMEGFFVQN